MKPTLALAGSIVLLSISDTLWAASAEYQHEATVALVARVRDAAALVGRKGAAAWRELKEEGSRWRQGENYLFVLDTAGNMVCHPDPSLEGRNQMDLKDVNGKPIIRGILRQAVGQPNRKEGWFHYQWPEPGSLFPSWKTTCAVLVRAPSGINYVVGSGVYDMPMEKVFVIDRVNAAVEAIEEDAASAFGRLRDPADEFLFKDTYVFVLGVDGTDLVNPGFPTLEGRNILGVRDRQGKPLVREMIDLLREADSGWVSYQWPKPGDYVSTEKSSYVRKARFGSSWVVVGCGVYLEGAPRQKPSKPAISAGRLVRLVRAAASVLEDRGEAAFAEFRVEGSRWREGETYLFVWEMAGTRILHAASPEGEGDDVRELKDVNGKPVGQMFIEAASSVAGEGWVHYSWPKPGDIFPAWKSTFVKRVKFPSGRDCLVGCGVYEMRSERAFVVDAVNAACALVAREGRSAFPRIRSRAGPFVFLDTYVFVTAPDGVELVSPAFPGLEGRNLIDVKDVRGRRVVREEIEVAMKKGAGWVTGYWPKPGEVVPARKQTYVRKVEHQGEVFIVGAGVYAD